MSTMIKWMLMAALATVVFVKAADNGRVVCYHANWSSYHLDRGLFRVTDIDTTLCTHLIYAFAGLNGTGGVVASDEFADLPDNGGEDGYGDFVKLKTINPDVKVLIGITAENYIFSRVARNSQLRSAFVSHVVAFVRQYGFDGISIEWVNPDAEDKDNYVALLSDLRPVFDQERLLLVAGVTGLQSVVEDAFDFPSLDRYLDFLNVMAMDFHGPWENVTGQNAPLFASRLDVTPQQREMNAAASINYVISRGVNSSKVVLGIAGYGSSFTLQSEKSAGLGAPAVGPGVAGPYSYEPGFMSYMEVCETLAKGEWNVSWDDDQKMSYASKRNQWLGYDDVDSVSAKVDYITSMGLGGAAFWNIALDDFRNLCGRGKFPLLTAINARLGSNKGNGTTLSKEQKRKILLKKLARKLQNLYAR